MAASKLPDRPRLTLGLLLAAAGCAAPERLDVDPAAMLAELDAVRLELSETEASADPPVGVFDPRDGLDAGEAAAFSVVRNPSLQAARAQLGVQQALIVQAGLLPDPTFAWNSVDWLVVDNFESVLTGFSLTMPLPAPGERKASRALAEAQLEVQRVVVLGAEWELERRVRLAWLERVAAEQYLALQARVAQLVEQSARFLARQREARTATAVESELAGLDLLQVELNGTRLRQRSVEARLELNRLLGLPPDAEVPVADAGLAGAAELPALDLPRAELLERRPDVAAALARWHAAEEDVALAAARRGPSFYVGTAFGVVLPIFSHANRPQLDVALARRARAVESLRAQLFDARADLVLAERRYELSRARVEQAAAALQPAVEALAQRLEEARGSRAVSAIELLATQRSLVAASRALLDARVDLARTRVELRAAAGPPARPREPEPDPQP